MTKQKNSGVTLIELIIVMTIMGFLGLGFLGLQYMIGQNRETSVKNYFNIDQANTSVNTFVREIRTARTSQAGTYTIESANDNELVFYSDADFDGETERVRYTLTGNILERGVVEPVGSTYPLANEKTKTISSNVRNTAPLFTYYNGDWPTDTVNNPLPNPIALSDVKIVRISITINTDDDDNNNFELESYAHLRTLKTNLGQ